MDVPVTANGEFVDSVLVNQVISTLMSSIRSIGQRLHSYGLFNPLSMTITPAGLVLTVQAPSPFAVLFSDGSLVAAHGNTNYSDSSTYTVNMAPLVPGSGSVTAYVVASKTAISQSLTTIIGPPPGHPDYDPSFAPYEFGQTTQDTLTITGTLTAPNNTTTFELCRVTLSVGQVTITAGQIDKTHWQYGSAVLNPTGVTAGNYPGATVTVGADGRITGISSVAYGPLAGNNTWTGTNTFNAQATTAGGFISNFIDAAGGGGQIRLVGGNYGVILRNDGTAMSLLQTASGNQNAGFNALRPFYWNLANGGVTIDGTGAGVVMGGAVQVTGILSIGTSGQFYLNPNQAGTQVLAFAGGQYLQYNPSQGFTLATSGSIVINGPGGITLNGVVSSNGNINSGARLRASLGALNSGDNAAATLLADFPNSKTAAGYTEFPNGVIIQWGAGTTATGFMDAVFLPISFPNFSAAVTICEAAVSGWNTGTQTATIYGTERSGLNAFYVGGARVTNGSPTVQWQAGIAYNWIAIGW
jgi:hypothetical protein